jgi:hypothetical protein
MEPHNLLKGLGYVLHWQAAMLIQGAIQSQLTSLEETSTKDFMAGSWLSTLEILARVARP